MGERLVVVGNGMAATRLVEELVARRADLEVTVVGAEPGPPYNRVLLSAVLEGSHPTSAVRLRSEGWYDEHGIALLSGARAVAVDRERCQVVLENGTVLPYERLVLATGSNPVLPPVRGLVRGDGRLHDRVHVFRSLADCTRLSTALPDARRVVVVGGGLLGIQVGRAVAARGLAVEVVEGSTHLLSSQVGARAGAVLRRSMRALGTEVYTGARAVRLDEQGLRLDNGYVLDTDLVVLAAGSRPATSLARSAGLFVRRGVVVDGSLRSVTDERVHAIGDCAEHRGRLGGFVAPAWEQASVLASVLTGGDATYDGARPLARLRARDLDVAVLGDPERTDGDVLELANPLAGTYRKAVLRDGVLEAAVLVGDLTGVAALSQAFDRRTRLGPDEPALLLAPSRAAASAVDPVALPDEAEVCACAGVTAGQIRGCRSADEVAASTRAGTGCGGCRSAVEAVLAG